MSCRYSDRTPPSPYISPEYLSELHGMSKDESELYYLFCRKHTIRFKECYGHGQIMMPLWNKEKIEAEDAIKKLIS